MDRIQEINYLKNKLNILLGYHYKNTGNLKLDTILAIQNIIKEILDEYQYMIQMRYLKMIYIDELKINKKIALVEKLIYLNQMKLRIIIYFIMLSKYFRETFEISKELKSYEINILVKDIQENILLLKFDNNNDISNYILAYIKKFAK